MMLAQVDFNQIDKNAFTNPGGVPGSALARFGPGTTLGMIIQAAVPWIFTIAGMVLLVYLIFGGLQLMVSRGDPKAAGGAKAHISNALIGFIIIFIAYWVVQLVGRIFGLTGIIAIFK